MTHRFTLERGPGTKRHICPGCQQKTLTRYIDKHTGGYLHDDVGICSRVQHCTYHLPPREYFRNTPQALEILKLKKVQAMPVKEEVLKEPSFIPEEVYDVCLRSYELNPFAIGLAYRIGEELTKYIIYRYKIGTSKQFRGSVVFPQIDHLGNIRSGKVMRYNPATLKRSKTEFNWLHRVLGIHDFNLKQCFFGEHLLRVFPDKRVVIVESEKTACIGTARYPQLIWLATGGLSGLTPEKCLCLTGRSVTLIPDLGVYEKWEKKVAPLRTVIQDLSITDFFEKNCSKEERERGDDIADFILKFWQNGDSTQKSSMQPTLPTLPTLQQTVAPNNPSSQETPVKANVNICDIEFIRDSMHGVEKICFRLMCEELMSGGKQEELDVERYEVEKNNPDESYILDFGNLDNTWTHFWYTYQWKSHIDKVVRPNGCMGVGFSFDATPTEKEKIKDSINKIFSFPNMILATICEVNALVLIIYVGSTPYQYLPDPDEKFTLYRKFLATRLGVREEAFSEISGMRYNYQTGMLVNYNNDSILSWESLQQRLIDEIRMEKR